LINLQRIYRKKYGKGFSTRYLWMIRQFYSTYPNLNALRAELSWTHYRLIMQIDDPAKRSFYEIECADNNWSTRELDRQINSLLFERLALSKDREGVLSLAKKGQQLECAPQSRQVVKVCLREGNHGKNIKKKIYT
jgi:hypothetical protein